MPGQWPSTHPLKCEKNKEWKNDGLGKNFIANEGATHPL
jgi:hypothetical protein